MGRRKSKMDKIVELMFEADTAAEAFGLAAVARNLAEQRFPKLKAVKKGVKDVRTAPQEAKS